MRIVFAVASSVALAASLALSGCAGGTYAEIDPGPFSSCSPSYVAPSKYGNFSIQQAGGGQAIQWGLYPNAGVVSNAAVWTVNVYLGTNRYDAKTQTYPPHGSVKADVVQKYRGKDIVISGKVVDGNVTVNFSLGCKIK